jgi:hypothetical protein
MDLYLHSPVRLHGVVLNYLSIGTTLPLPYLLGGTATVCNAAFSFTKTNQDRQYPRRYSFLKRSKGILNILIPVDTRIIL